MRRVGDDVVDLHDPAIAVSHESERFVARVCAPAEREALARARDRKLRLWSLFAAKEAAYKAIARHAAAPPPFAHRRFVVADDLESVRYGELPLSLVVTVAGACVHAVAWSGGAPAVETGVVRPGETPGAAARRLLDACLGGGVEVVRPARPGSWDGYGPPVVRRAGAPLDVTVSLSHDGRFASCAALTGVMTPAAADGDRPRLP